MEEIHLREFFYVPIHTSKELESHTYYAEVQIYLGRNMYFSTIFDIAKFE